MHTVMTRTGRAGIALAATAALVLGLGACSSQGAGDDTSSSSSAASLPTLTLAMVNSLDNAPFIYAQQHGYFTDAGVKVKFGAASDGGPAIVTGVLNGTYDIGSAAPLPILVAVTKGSPLRILTDVTKISRDKDGSSVLLVKDDSPIKSYADLAGKTIATNALTSTGTLADKIAAKQAGVDPSSLKFTVLPFKTGVQSVLQGQIDAALTIEPLGTEALLAGGVRSIGDPMDDALPENSPYGFLFTSEKAATQKPKALAAFDKAIKRAIAKIADDEQLQRTMAHTETGVPENVAKKVVLPNYSTGPIDVDALQQYADVATEYGFLPKKMDVTKYLVKQ